MIKLVEVEDEAEFLGRVRVGWAEYRKRGNVDDELVEFLSNFGSDGCRYWLVGETGFGVTEVQWDVSGDRILVVRHLYAPRLGLIREFDRVVGAWAKASRCDGIGFYTRREPHGFERLLGNGWELDSYVMRRDL